MLLLKVVYETQKHTSLVGAEEVYAEWQETEHKYILQRPPCGAIYRVFQEQMNASEHDRVLFMSMFMIVFGRLYTWICCPCISDLMPIKRQSVWVYLSYTITLQDMWWVNDTLTLFHI